jgi:starch synthase
MKIAFASTECVPYAKTGGLADVAGSLPSALEKLGCEVKVFIPKYFTIDESKHDLNYIGILGKCLSGSTDNFVLFMFIRAGFLTQMWK